MRQILIPFLLLSACAEDTAPPEQPRRVLAAEVNDLCGPPPDATLDEIRFAPAFTRWGDGREAVIFYRFAWDYHAAYLTEAKNWTHCVTHLGVE